MKRMTFSITEEIEEKFNEIRESKGNITPSSLFRLMVSEYGNSPVYQPKTKPEKEEKVKKPKEPTAHDKAIKEMFIPKKVCYVCKERVDATKLVVLSGEIVSACNDCIKEKDLKEPSKIPI